MSLSLRLARALGGFDEAFKNWGFEDLELGYRAQPARNWSYAVTAWYGAYDKLRTLEPNTTPGPYRGALEFRNLAEGRARGIEFWAR